VSSQGLSIHSAFVSFRRLWRPALIGLGIVLLAGIAAPFVDGSRFSGQIQQTLETTLGRTIHFESVHFTFFSGPGFSLQNVTIGEDERYGLEPFAFVPVLQAHVRLDKLLVGKIQFSSLRLVEPSLNFVKRSDETWNVVELVGRLSAPRRMPLNLFPVVEVSNGRINFKFGIRKSTLYVLDSDLSIYPERSGKLFIQFSGSPARTDRAGNGFGHLRGRVNWYVNRKGSIANQLEADLRLDPSNLSEIATLMEGHDIGVHGTVSSHAAIEGPMADLRIRGELRLGDVHRWDLLPSSGEDLRIQYGGKADLLAHNLTLNTFGTRAGEVTPVTLEMLVSDFLTNPRCFLNAHLTQVPIGSVLPLGRRMGLAVPPDLTLTGTMGGIIHYATEDGLNGNVEFQNIAATLPDVPPLNVPRAGAAIMGDRLRFDPTEIQTNGATLQVGGEFYLSMPHTEVSISGDGYPIQEFKRALHAWFGMPEALRMLKDGQLSGQVAYRKVANEDPLWSGQVRFSQAALELPALAVPLQRAEGRVKFDQSELELTQLKAAIGSRMLRGSYRYNPDGRRPEHLHIEMPAADLGEIQALLAPMLEAQGWLARLRVAKRRVPDWLAQRNLEGEFDVAKFSVADASLGPLWTHFIWQGTNVQFSSVRLRLPAGILRAEGTVNLSSYSPRCAFTADVSNYEWGGGLLSAEGSFDTEGVGGESLRNLHATGSFSGSHLNLSPEDAFSKIAGDFSFSFADGWPHLQLSKVQASEEESAWTGEAASQSDGKLVFDLQHAGQQRKIVSSLMPENPSAVSQLNH
jgi:hypothetical protein